MGIEDFERFYFQYQTEALPHGESLQSFCVKNKVPYNIFQKWYKDTRNKVFEVRVDGIPIDGDEEALKTSNQTQSVSKSNKDNLVRIDNRSYSLFKKKFVVGCQFMKVERNGVDAIYRIDWKDVVLITGSYTAKMLKIR